MDEDTKKRDMNVAALRDHYMRSLSEPIPPRLKALIELLREAEKKRAARKNGD
ncbi:MAG: hypothetical protein AAGK93_03800 [Pseudomonadota bacterium]